MAGVFEIFLMLIGIYSLLFYLYDVLKAPTLLIFHFLKRCVGCNDINLKEKYGDWAAITGSTDGIGKEYACQLAARGLNIILISRNLDKLNAVAKEIEEKYLVMTKVIVADFSKGTEPCKFVESQLDQTPVRVLINNVGQTTTDPGPMAAFKDEELWSVILTNIGAVTQLSRYFIKRLHNEKQKGIIVNVSSGTAYFPVSNNAVYAATKAYTHSLTLALQEEARPYGIDVQLLSPHFVLTKIINYGQIFKLSHLVLPTAKTFARAAVNRLGKVEQTTGYFQHDVEYALLRMCPWRLSFFITNLFFKFISKSISRPL